MAVVPSLHDPQMNTAECVIKGHKKASNFSGLKQLLHGVCWSLLVISLVMSVFLSQWILVQLSKWDKEKEKHQSNIVAVMVLSLFIFVGGLVLNVIAISWTLSAVQQDSYVYSFFGAVFVVLLRRAGWCILVHHRNSKRRNSQLSECFKMGFTAGHGEETSKNIVSMFILYPATFMACHHVLWILLGIITEPFWGFTVFVAIISVCAVFYFLFSELYKAIYPKPEESRKDKFVLFVSVVLVIAGISAFVLLVMVLFVVAQSFLSENLITTIVQTVLLFVLTVWFKYMGLRVGTGEGGEGRGREIADERERRVEDQGNNFPLVSMNQNNN